MQLSHHRAATGPLPVPRRNRGAALVEFALIGLFLCTIVGATYDFGMAWRQSLVTNEAARGGARTGSSLGKTYLADWYALSNARAALASANRLGTVQRVVIYKSTAANGAAPATCLAGASTVALCDVLTGAQFQVLTQADFNTTTGCIATAKAIAANWCPSSRNNIQLNADYYGFLVITSYTNQFKLTGNNPTITRSVVMRMEPAVS